MAIFGNGTAYGRSMTTGLKPPAPGPKFGFGTSGGTEFGRNIGSGFNGTLKAAVPPPPKASPTPTAGTPATPGTPAQGPGTGYDSQYYIDLAQATQKANDSVAGYQQAMGYAGTQLQQNQATLARNLALSQTNAQNAENARGGFGQGALGTRLGNIGTANAAQGYALQQKYGHDMQNWTSAITSAQNGLSTETIALQLAARDRQAALVAGSGGTLGTTPGTPGTPGTSGTTSGGTSGSGGRGTTGASLTGLTAAKPKAPKLMSPPKVGRNQFGYHGGF